MDTPSASQLSDTTWHPPQFHFISTSTPSLLSRTRLEYDSNLPDNFPRTAKWCGDGSSLMVQCENRSFQMFQALTDDVVVIQVNIVGVVETISGSPPSVSYARSIAASPLTPSLEHTATFLQSAPIVDFAWHPGASRHNLPAFCFVASVRDCPVKLLDGIDGRLRASYPVVDHRERYIAPHSLAFNLTTDKLYCGFEDAIEIFDVQRPGEGERLHTTPSKKSKDGLKGYYAAGSLTPASRVSDNIALFNESALEPVLSIGGVADWERGGVTQLMFNPMRPHVLYAAFRRSERLWGWDLRGDPSVPLYYFSNKNMSNGSGHYHLTNQRRRFDVEGTGKWLASGSQIGEIAMYDLGMESGESLGSGSEVAEGPRQNAPALLFGAHDDAIGAVAFHPLQPFLLSVSGSRHFDGVGSTATMSGEPDSDSEWSDESNEGDGVVSRLKNRPQPSVRDASIKMWDFRSPRSM